MTNASPEPRVPSPDEAKLRKTAQQLEALFVEQLFKAMRETVPQGEGAVGAGTGEDMFTGLMDQHLAADTPTQWAHGLADAAYRQLRAALPQNASQNAPQNASQHAQQNVPPTAQHAPAPLHAPASVIPLPKR